MMIINNNENTIVDTFDRIEFIEYIKDGQTKEFKSDNKDLATLIEKLKNTFSNGHLMPAFGVSIHDLTIEDMKKGEWIKLHFNQEQEKNGLPFTSLLFKLDETYGINLIREYENRYDGRCIYIDFTEKVDLRDLVR